jgi:HSP20 family protein
MSTLVKTYVPSFPSLLENFLRNDTFAPSFEQTLPAVNVIENENGFKIELAAPGLKKEDFKVNVVENTLTISAEQEAKKEETGEKFTRKEFSYSSFKRSFTLPKTVDGEQISATYNEGILVLALPKKEEAKPKEPRLIEIA